MEVKTTPKVKHDKPDMMYWNKNELKCFIIDICIPLDQNIKSNEKTKLDRYMPLSVELKRLYPEYSFVVVPVVIGATGLVTNSLVTSLKDIGFLPDDMKSLIPNLQVKALIGSMRIMKSAMSLKK